MNERNPAGAGREAVTGLFDFLERDWRPWVVKLICCGRDDGEYRALTWEEADQFREDYTSGAGVASHWSRPWEGHVRSAIIAGRLAGRR